MQTPAPFEYERASSVDGAIASLVRLGSDARLIAGGHSLLPMMKLTARESRASDRHQRPGRALLHPSGGGRDPDRRTHAPRGATGIRSARGAVPGVPRRRGGDRRSGGAQPRHDRRIAVPGRSGGGPERGVLGAQGAGGDPRLRGRAGDRHGGVPRRPVHDRGRRRGDADRGADPGPARGGQRAREGRAACRRLRDRGRVGRRVDRRRHDRRRRGGARGRGTEHGARDPRRRAVARQVSVRGAVRAGG